MKPSDQITRPLRDLRRVLPRAGDALEVRARAAGGRRREVQPAQRPLRSDGARETFRDRLLLSRQRLGAQSAEAHFANTPWPADVQREHRRFVNNRRDVVSGQTDADRWLDSICYYELLDKLRYGAEVKRYIDPLLGVGNFGVCGNAISAYAAKRLTLPGTIPSNTPNRFEGVDVVSFPGGNAVFVRRMVARMIPGALSGDGR